MTEREFDKAYAAGKLDEVYANYIMENGDPTERCICNGDTLITAMEDGYLLNEFKHEVTA